jgi:hypothetical protein
MITEHGVLERALGTVLTLPALPLLTMVSPPMLRSPFLMLTILLQKTTSTSPLSMTSLYLSHTMLGHAYTATPGPPTTCPHTRVSPSMWMSSPMRTQTSSSSPGQATVATLGSTLSPLRLLVRTQLLWVLVPWITIIWFISLLWEATMTLPSNPTSSLQDDFFRVLVFIWSTKRLLVAT